jgi:hypothetical protein
MSAKLIRQQFPLECLLIFRKPSVRVNGNDDIRKRLPPYSSSKFLKGKSFLKIAPRFVDKFFW